MIYLTSRHAIVHDKFYQAFSWVSVVIEKCQVRSLAYKASEFSCDSYFSYTLIPGNSHLQSLITYSIQVWKGKASEIWSRAVMSCRHRVDTWGDGAQ